MTSPPVFQANSAGHRTCKTNACEESNKEFAHDYQRASRHSCVFDNHEAAQTALHELRRSGFRDDDIGFIARNAVRSEDGAASSTTAQGAATGAAIGGTVGVLWGAGVVSGLVPGIGPAIAGGTLAALLASAATGAGVAGVIGALVGLGVSTEEAHAYERQLRAGRVLLVVRTPWAR